MPLHVSVYICLSMCARVLNSFDACIIKDKMRQYSCCCEVLSCCLYSLRTNIKGMTDTVSFSAQELCGLAHSARRETKKAILVMTVK